MTRNTKPVKLNRQVVCLVVPLEWAQEHLSAERTEVDRVEGLRYASLLTDELLAVMPGRAHAHVCYDCYGGGIYSSPHCSGNWEIDGDMLDRAFARFCKGEDGA